MSKKPKSTNTVKNRHIQKDVKERKYPDYDFPNYIEHLFSFCTIDELEEAFFPTKTPQATDPITKS